MVYVRLPILQQLIQIELVSNLLNLMVCVLGVSF